MCLQTIDNVSKYKDGFGWKVFGKDEVGGLHPDMQGTNVWPVGEWIKAEGRPIHMNDDILLPSYKAGFHILPTKREAEEYKSKRVSTYNRITIRKVEYRNVTATGTGKLFESNFCSRSVWDGRCIVATEMRIVETK